MSSRVDHTLATVVRALLGTLNARSMLDRSARSACDLPFWSLRRRFCNQNPHRPARRCTAAREITRNFAIFCRWRTRPITCPTVARSLLQPNLSFSHGPIPLRRLERAGWRPKEHCAR